MTHAGVGDKLVLNGRSPVLLSQLGLPGQSITLALADAGGEFYRASVPASALVANSTGTVAGGITTLTIGGTLRTTLSIRARNLNLGGAAAGPFTAQVTIGDLTLEAAGALRPSGTRLVYP